MIYNNNKSCKQYLSSKVYFYSVNDKYQTNIYLLLVYNIAVL